MTTSNTPTIPGYSASDLEGMSPDEIQALQDDAIEGAQDADDLALIADEGEEGEEAKDADGKVIEAKADETNTDTPAEEPAAAHRAYTAAAPTDAAAQLEAFKLARTTAKAEDKAALKRLHDGEIDFEEYETAKTKADEAIDAADDSINSLRRDINKAEIAAEMTSQAKQTEWANELKNLTKTAKAEGLDYSSAAMNKEFNDLLYGFAIVAERNNLSDDNLEASRWALKQAHDMMRFKHAAILTKPAAAAAASAPAAQRHSLQSLGGLPNADRAQPDSDSIAKFSQLEGDDLERALASMSKADVDKLMASV
jgi:hypothetical protein